MATPTMYLKSMWKSRYQLKSRTPFLAVVDPLIREYQVIKAHTSVVADHKLPSHSGIRFREGSQLFLSPCSLAHAQLKTVGSLSN